MLSLQGKPVNEEQANIIDSVVAAWCANKDTIDQEISVVCAKGEIVIWLDNEPVDVESLGL